MALKIWNGSSWPSAQSLRVWNGSSWTSATNGKIWNGTTWVTFFSPGVGPQGPISPIFLPALIDINVFDNVADGQAFYGYGTIEVLNNGQLIVSSGNSQGPSPAQQYTWKLSGLSSEYEVFMADPVEFGSYLWTVGQDDTNEWINLSVSKTWNFAITIPATSSGIEQFDQEFPTPGEVYFLQSNLIIRRSGLAASAIFSPITISLNLGAS